MTVSNDISTNLAKNRLYLECYKFLQAEDLELPTIPDIAIKLRKAIHSAANDSRKIAQIIQLDPVITAKLIQISNSPLYRGRRQIDSCPEALTRIGINAAQDIVTSLAIKSVFNAKSHQISRKMAQLWAHSSHVAAISAVLAHKIPGFDPDRAMLAGLIHDIGAIPILIQADKQPDIFNHANDLAETIRELRKEIGVHIIQKWEFPGDFEAVVIHAENWHKDNNTETDYADIVMIAQRLCYLNKDNLPELKELPAYKKISSSALIGDDITTHILESAKEEISLIQRLLNSG